MILNIFIALLLNQISFINSSPIHKTTLQSQRRTRNALDSDFVDEIIKSEIIPLNPSEETGQCMFVKTEEGTYSFASTGSSNDICGLYVISEPDHVIEFEFDEFDVSCTKGGLLSVIDGWELNGQFFPGTEDHPIPRHQRYHEFCGIVKPWKPFKMTQNVGLLEFRIPTRGEGFTVRVRFIENPKPCNAVLQNPQGVYTLRNYGRRVNCTISIIFPESFQVLASNIGAQDRRVGSMIPSRNAYVETGIIRKCKKRGMQDYVEIRGGDGLDPHLMTVAEDFCGVDSIASKHKVDVVCGNTAVRLVSSGRHDNSVTLAFQLLSDIVSPALVCPAMLEAFTSDTVCELFRNSWYNMVESGDLLIEPQIFMILLVVFALFASLFTISVVRKLRPRMSATILSHSSQPRFRKRDKVMFYGRKMLRKVRSSLQATSRIRGKKRQMVLRFAKRLLRLKREQPLQLQVKEPSQAFLEEEIGDQCEQPLPPEVIYMLKSIRVFGFFDKPLFLELCKNLEFVNVSKGQLLFYIGDADDSIYIVQTGRLQVFLTEPDGTELVLKEVTVGESIASMLSVMDVLTGHLAPFKTVSAKAIEDSTILRLQVELFRDMLEKYPDSLVRVVQVIMVRLQRVTFTALHHYLGLTTQLLNPGLISRRTTSSTTTTAHQTSLNNFSPPKSSPLRPTTLPSLLKQHSQSYSGTEANELKSILKSMAESEINQKDMIPENCSFENKINENRNKTDDESPRRQKSLNTYFGLPENQKFKRRRSFMLNDDRIHGLEESEIFKVAVDGLMQALNIDDPNLLKTKISLKDYSSGVYLTHEDTHEENSLFYVLSGSLIVSQNTIDKSEENNLFVVYPGEIVGALSVITGEPSLFTIKTRQMCKIAVITKDNIYDILTEYPKAVLHLAHAVIQRLSTFVRQIDFALDWIHYESGRAIYRQGDRSDCTYIVLSGRLRSVITRSNGKKEFLGEFGRGDLVGLVEVITHTPRSTTVMAVRDTELAKLPDGLLEAIKIKYPVVVTRLIHLLGHRILGSLQKPGNQILTSAESMGTRPTGSNFATVALISVSDDVPLQAFTMELYHALTSIGSVSHLTSELIRSSLGPTAFERPSEYRLCSWLAQQEDQHRIVLYQCDTHFSAWTQRCIRQADCILIVALANQEPLVGHVEKQLEHLAIRTQKELVLLHNQDSDKPRNTVKWLNMRSWCSSHHHIRCPKRMFKKRSVSKIKEIYSSLFANPPSIHSDFSRLARFLTGTSIGLVLGGGGARGAAHVGMIKAINESGIPIDMVGGVSIGAFMGALWCQENNLITFTQKARSWSHSMTSYWRQILDLTYPVTAMFTGNAFNVSINEVFGERQIEDLWLPYFTLTTDITSSCPRIHRYGSLWRYVRSSMSLSGYLPPLCDPIDGHLLLDGGYVNNLPADVMRDVMGAETILAIDVGSQDDIDMTNYGDTLSGWWLLWKRWNPFSKPVRVPNLPEIQSRLAYVSCVRLLEEVKQSNYCHYIRPPIDRYKTLQFGSFDEIMDVGYNHGKTLFTAMRLDEHKLLQSLLQVEHNKVDNKQGINAKNDYRFTDLAERVCKIKTPKHNQFLNDLNSFEDISDENEYISEPDYQTFGTDTDTDSTVSKLKHRKVSTIF